MSNKRPYSYVELWKRKKIIECSLTKKESVKKCAQRLGVKYITAKHIVKVYKRTGQIETKIMKKSSNRDSKHDLSISAASIKIPEVQDYCFEHWLNNNGLQEGLNAQGLLWFNNEFQYYGPNMTNDCQSKESISPKTNSSTEWTNYWTTSHADFGSWTMDVSQAVNQLGTNAFEYSKITLPRPNGVQVENNTICTHQPSFQSAQEMNQVQPLSNFLGGLLFTQV